MNLPKSVEIIGKICPIEPRQPIYTVSPEPALRRFLISGLRRRRCQRPSGNDRWTWKQPRQHCHSNQVLDMTNSKGMAFNRRHGTAATETPKLTLR
ncbi:hypothetical protein Pan258_34870 [Symmachiella dynata]|uniref:Uncharacterized protein n=1 Tax=Symmachiella dynata TaxID=2527995 RepID=A0A517ZRJ9_9PLAN|nr:hypothetical protein Pan258_34870 [Symmachiella dynata]QDU45109.1 hypothetical protein Mal52_35970 [Symmachiella dynata]